MDMTKEDARKIFNDIIAKETDPDRIAKLELLREYFTNPEFRVELHNITFEMSK